MQSFNDKSKPPPFSYGCICSGVSAPTLAVKRLGWKPAFFSEIDKFDTQDTRDLRNMREHVVDYFQGRGNNQDRWWVETPEFKADASTMVGNIIGGRLDYKAFAEAARRLLPQLLKEPVPTSRNTC